jgi:hypothetical protein
MMNLFTGMNSPTVGELDDELTAGLESYDQKLDSMQAGTVGEGPRPTAAVTGTPVGAPQQMGPPAPAGYGQPQMPGAYTENRSAKYGMPGIFQFGESLVDDYRAKKWTENQGMQQLEQIGIQDDNAPGSPAGQAPPVQVDEVEMLNSGGDPQVAYNARQAQGNTGSGSASIGAGIGKIGGAIANAYTGGMFNQAKGVKSALDNEDPLAAAQGIMGFFS